MEYSCERPSIFYLHPSLFSSLTLSPVFGWEFLLMLVIQKPNQMKQKTPKHNNSYKSNKTKKKKNSTTNPECQQRIYREMQSRTMLQIKLRLRLSKIQKLSAICNYSGNCYFKMFSFFQRNSMLLSEILRILNHSKSLCSWWRLNIIGNQKHILSTYFSWFKKK